MRELVVDNGTEFHSASLKNSCYTLGIEIHYSARKTPWFKGKIERFFRSLNAAVAHRSPGTTFSNVFEKDDYDPVKYSVVRFSALQEIVRRWVADVYHQKPHRSLHEAPATVWRASISGDEIQLPDDPELLAAILSRSEQRRLTHKGIELDGLLYNSPEMTELRRQLGDSIDVDIRIDDSNLGRIYVISPHDGQLLTATALAASYADGLSRWQHQVCKKYASRHLEKFDHRGWLAAKAEIAQLVADELVNKKRKMRKKAARFAAGTQSTKPVTTLALPAPRAPVAPPIPAEPLTAPDLKTTTAPRRERRFTAKTRDRLPQLIEADQRESLKDKNNG